MRLEIFLGACDFFGGFSDGCHHEKEEGVPFIAMADNGVPVDEGPVRVMLAEHEQTRIYNRGMRAGVEKLWAGDLAGVDGIIRNGLGYANLLRQHITKEDVVLFPMAEFVFPPAKQDHLLIVFEMVEKERSIKGYMKNIWHWQ